MRTLPAILITMAVLGCRTPGGTTRPPVMTGPPLAKNKITILQAFQIALAQDVLVHWPGENKRASARRNGAFSSTQPAYASVQVDSRSSLLLIDQYSIQLLQLQYPTGSVHVKDALVEAGEMNPTGRSRVTAVQINLMGNIITGDVHFGWPSSSRKVSPIRWLSESLPGDSAAILSIHPGLGIYLESLEKNIDWTKGEHATGRILQQKNADPAKVIGKWKIELDHPHPSFMIDRIRNTQRRLKTFVDAVLEWELTP